MTDRQARRRPLDAVRPPFVGREQDLEQLLHLARRRSTRCLTLVGLGGIGKTRLAVELTTRLAADRDPFVVELAAVVDPDDVLPSIAEALLLTTVGDDPFDDVCSALAGRPTVLLLDNLEQVPGAGGLVVDLLAAVPELLVVATSRVPLGIVAEQLWRLQPLDLPDESLDDGALAAGDHAAVQLFCSVASAADGRFVLDDDTRADVVAICRRLGGHPLAIELAAARIVHLGPATLRHELERRSSTMFTAGRVDVPERQRDLAGAIAWSLAELDPASHRLFRLLGVFESWTTLDLVEAFVETLSATCSEQGHGSGESSIDVLESLGVLVDHHLLEVVHDPHGSRYRLLPPVRDVARSLLDDPAERGAAQTAHERSHHAFAAAALSVHDEPGGHRWAAALDGVRPDLTAALERATSAGRATAAADLASALAWVWSGRRVFGVHVARVDAAVATCATATARTDPRSRALLHGWQMVMHALLGASPERLRELDRRRPPIGPPPVDQLDVDPSPLLLDDRAATTTMLIEVLRAYALAHDTDGAADAGNDALAFTSGGDDRWEARAEALAGMVANLRRDHDRAHRLGLASLDRARRIGDDKTVVRAALLLAPLEQRLGTRSIELDEAYAVAQRLGDPEAIEWTLPAMAAAAMARGDVAAAAHACAEAFRPRSGPGGDRGAMCAAVMAVMVAADAPATTARIHGMLRDRFRLVESHLLPPQRALLRAAIDGARTRIGDAAFEAAYAAGAQLDWRSAVQELHRIAVERSSRASSDDTSELRRADADGTEVAGPPPDPADALTRRELEVLRVLATGATNKEISVLLGLTPKTVMHHTSAIYRKLEVRGRTEAAARWHVMSGDAPGDALVANPT